MKIENKKNTTEGSYIVRLDEVNSRHQLTAAAAIGYLQEAAWKASVEWGVSIYDLQKDGFTWVLSRLSILVNKLPSYLDKISYETWISRYEKVFSQRDLQFSIEERVLFEAATQWIVLDTNYKKLVRLPEELIEKFLNKEKKPIEAFENKIPTFDEADYSYQMTVRWHDLDINQHTNNKHYFRWALDALPAEILENQELKKLDFQFKGETLLGDELTVSAKKTDNGFLHKIVNQSGKEIIRGLTYFSL